MKIELFGKFKSLVLLSIYLLASILTASAQTSPGSHIEESLTCLICKFFYFFFYISSAIASLVIVVAGVKWIGSGDDLSARNGAKNAIINAIIGLIVVIIAVYLVEYLVDFDIVMLDPTTFINGCTGECTF